MRMMQSANSLQSAFFLSSRIVFAVIPQTGLQQLSASIRQPVQSYAGFACLRSDTTRHQWPSGEQTSRPSILPMPPALCRSRILLTRHFSLQSSYLNDRPATLPHAAGHALVLASLASHSKRRNPPGCAVITQQNSTVLALTHCAARRIFLSLTRNGENCAAQIMASASLSDIRGWRLEQYQSASNTLPIQSIFSTSSTADGTLSGCSVVPKFNKIDAVSRISGSRAQPRTPTVGTCGAHATNAKKSSRVLPTGYISKVRSLSLLCLSGIRNNNRSRRCRISRPLFYQPQDAGGTPTTSWARISNSRSWDDTSLAKMAAQVLLALLVLCVPRSGISHNVLMGIASANRTATRYCAQSPCHKTVAQAFAAHQENTSPFVIHGLSIIQNSTLYPLFAVAAADHQKPVRFVPIDQIPECCAERILCQPPLRHFPFEHRERLSMRVLPEASAFGEHIPGVRPSLI